MVAEMATKKCASTKRKSTTKTRDAKPSRSKEGLKKLSKEADKTIEKDCGVILSALRDKVKGGNIGCAKLLIELAERDEPEEGTAEAEARCESLAEWLSKQGEWSGFKAEKN